MFVGRDFERKGGFVTYQAFCVLKQNFPDLELYIAGPKTNPIKNPIDGAFFCGDVGHEKLAELYRKCDIFCMPSYFEAYGLVFAEALICGLPCIGRNCYEMPYFIEDGETGCLLSQDGSAQELAEKINFCLANNDIKKNVAARHAYYVQEYSWETVAKRIKDVIDKF